MGEMGVDAAADDLAIWGVNYVNKFFEVFLREFLLRNFIHIFSKGFFFIHNFLKGIFMLRNF